MPEMEAPLAAHPQGWADVEPWEKVEMPRMSSDLTDRFPYADYAVLEEVLDRAEAARLSVNRAADVSVVAKIPYKARDLLQIGLRRNLELAQAFIASFNAGLFTPLFVLGRAAVETGCLMWEFWVRVRDIVERHDKGALDDFDVRVTNAVFGAKTTAWVGDPAVHPAPNVLTIIDRQAKEIPRLREFYDALSEFAHPNYSGMHGVYCQVQPAVRESHFIDRPLKHEAEGLDLPVNALIAGMSQALFAVEQYERRLGEFASVCEEAIHDGGTWPAGLPYPVVRK